MGRSATSDGKSYTDAAKAAGRRSGDAVSQLVSRFNQEGIVAMGPRHGSGPQTIYGVAERERILAQTRRQPDPKQDGTATWSLTTLQHALRQAADGLPRVSTYTIWVTLQEAGWSWQENRTWCDTDKVKRKRKDQAKRMPHEHIRNGTAKLMTLFHPATGQVQVKGMLSCTNSVLHRFVWGGK